MTTKLQGRDIVVVGQQPWDEVLGSNCKDVAREFARHNRVLYVNAPLDRNTLLRRGREPAVRARRDVLRGRVSGLESVAPNLWVLQPDTVLESINWLPAGRLHGWLNGVNNRRFARAIQKGLGQLGFRNFVLFNDGDMVRSFFLKELLRPDVSVYYSRDYMVSGGYWHRHGERLEPALMAKSDVCVTNSDYLADYCRLHNPHVFNAGQGCAMPVPPAPGSAPPPGLAGLPHPLIGYVGALTSARLDIGVLRYLAQQRPAWSFVLVGPEDEVFKNSDLHRLPNVHFTGSRPTTELAAYVSAFDVCLNPQLVNPLTVGNYPRKIDEYLALGKPTVATLTQAMREFAAHTYLASSPPEYLALVEQALAEDSPARQQARREYAGTHTWESSVGRIYEAIASCYARRAGRLQPAAL